jgi:hypothetical protein
MAFQSVICGLYGYERIEGDVVHLWHPRSEERITPGQTRLTATPEYVTNARLGRRYMVALRRDHALHDRGDMPASEEERQRDIANLRPRRREVRDRRPAARPARLVDWWPTLEELRDGAKAYRTARRPDRAGHGRRPDRRRARDVGRAVASTSGARSPRSTSGCPGRSSSGSSTRTGAGPPRRARGDRGEHGFYVVGPSGHVGYTGDARGCGVVPRGRRAGEYVFATEDDFVYDRPSTSSR